MDLAKMIAELQDERNRLNEAIEALERLTGSGQARRRGRPPRQVTELLAEDADMDEVPQELVRSKKA